MQVQVIQGGNGISANDAFRALVLPPPDNRLLNYLQDNVEHAKQAISGISDNFVNMASTMYDKFNNSEAINAGKALLYGMGTHMGQNIIYPLSYDQLGQANMVMQRYIMAEPAMNKMYNANTCDGYSNTYIDIEPDNTGTERMDYRNVMDGVLVFEKDGTGAINYYSDSSEYEELDTFDRFSILSTWDAVTQSIIDDIDPSSVNGSGL